MSPAGTAATLVGVDVGGTKIQVIVTDARFRPLGRSRGPTPGTGGPPAVVAAIHGLVTEALRDAGTAAGTVAAVGVGAPGTIDRATGVV